MPITSKRCASKFCRGRTTHTGHSPFCSKCRTRNFKAKFPLKYAFGKLRARARERGHDFQLTFEQYQKFAVDTGYDQLKGKHAASLSINRKDNSKGYHIDNIEVVTLSHNSRLRFAKMPAWLKEEMLAAERKWVGV